MGIYSQQPLLCFTTNFYAESAVNIHRETHEGIYLFTLVDLESKLLP